MPKIALHKPRVGVFTGYHRIVTEVRDRNDAHTFIGDFVPDREELEVKVGTIIIEKRDKVEVLKGGRLFEWRAGCVTDDGGIVWGKYYDEAREFKHFRDQVKFLLSR